ncbi:MAG: hypothetical protein ABI193_21295 [Minicystis sp.]
MATPEKHILGRMSARLVGDIDPSLPDQVARLLELHGTHEWASGKRFGADQAIVVTIAGYVIDVAYTAWAFCKSSASSGHRSLADVPKSTALQTLLEERIRTRVHAPEGIPGYILAEVRAVGIEEALAEAERHEPHA